MRPSTRCAGEHDIWFTWGGPQTLEAGESTAAKATQRNDDKIKRTTVHQGHRGQQRRAKNGSYGGVRTRQGNKGAAPPGVAIGSGSERSVKAWRPPVFGELAGPRGTRLLSSSPGSGTRDSFVVQDNSAR